MTDNQKRYLKLGHCSDKEWLVIDKDSGTVLGTNVVVATTKGLTEQQIEDICTCDEDAIGYAQAVGLPLFFSDNIAVPVPIDYSEILNVLYTFRPKLIYARFIPEQNRMEMRKIWRELEVAIEELSKENG